MALVLVLGAFDSEALVRPVLGLPSALTACSAVRLRASFPACRFAFGLS